VYDVIIIGAGPTGSSAAKKLTGDGFRVLLVEKLKLPRNKSCSGILIKKSMDLVRAYFNEDIPPSVMCSPTDNRGMIFTNDDGQEFIYEQEGLNIWRSSFDHWLSKNTGAEIRDSTIALSCEEKNDSVTVTLKGESEYSEQAKIVIVCEGVSRSIKRKLTHAPKDNIITYQTFNIGSITLDPHYFYAYLQPNLSEYDAWFNVKDNFLVFGVAVRDASKIEHYYAEFIAYMKITAQCLYCPASEQRKMDDASYFARLPNRLRERQSAICGRSRRFSQSNGRGHIRRIGKRLCGSRSNSIGQLRYAINLSVL